MEIVLLGTGTSIPHPDRASPGCLIRIEGVCMLFDLGSGTLKRLAEAGISYLDIDNVFLTHFHPDHTGDLVPLLFACRNPYHRREKKLTIAGPPGTRDFYRGLRGVYGINVEAEGYELHITEVRGTYETGKFSVSSIRVPHTDSSVAYRVSSGRDSIVISGDTEASQELVEFSKGADIVIYECSFRDDMEASGHLTPTLAARMAQEAGIGKLILTHFYPVFEGYDIEEKCRSVYDGEVVVGRDLMKLQLE